MKAYRYMLLMFTLLLCLVGIHCKNESPIVIQTPKLQVESLFIVNGNASVTLGWTDVENGAASGIEIHRSGGNNFTPSSQTLLTTLSPTVTIYTDTGLVNAAQYYYCIVPIQNVDGFRRQGIPSEISMGRPYDYSTVGSITFSEHIQPMFLSSCAGVQCHSGEHGGVSATRMVLNKTAHGGDLSLTEWEDLFKGGDHGAVIIPFRANKSHLVFHINTDTTIAPVSEPHMPLPGFNIPQDQLSTFMRWIDEGAPNDFGAIAFSTYPEGKVLATNQAEDVVSIIDIKTQLVARYVQAGHPRVLPGLSPEAPHNLVVDKTNGYYYVNLVTAGKIVKYRLSDNTKLGELSGVLLPTQIALTPGGDTGFVSQFSDQAHAIRMFDTKTMQLFPQSFFHPQLSKPHGVQLTPDAKQLFITGNLSDNIIVLDVATGALNPIWLDPASPTVGTNFLPYQTVMTKNNKYAYVSCQRTNEVRVIDRDSMKVVKSVPVGSFPLIMDITPDNQFIYVANRNSGDVSVIRTSDNTVITTIPNVGPQPHGVAIDSHGKYAYITCENTGSTGPPPHHPTSGSKAPGYVVVIDIATNTVVKTIEVANFAAGIVVVD